MPPPPGSSRRCTECRLRRVKVCEFARPSNTILSSRCEISNSLFMLKCGLEQPRCNRCEKSGIQCSGASDGQLFIRRDMSNVQEISDRDMLNLAIRNRNNSTSTQCRRSLQAGCRINKPVDHPSPLSTISSVGVSTGLYRSVVDDFWILSCDPANNSARQAVEASMSYCGQVILPLAFRNRALDAAIFTAATMYIGQVRGDVNLRRLAMDAYSTALCRFRSELTKAFESKPEQRYPKDVVMAILMSLLLLEVSSPLTRNAIGTTDRSVPALFMKNINSGVVVASTWSKRGRISSPHSRCPCYCEALRTSKLPTPCCKTSLYYHSDYSRMLQMPLDLFS
jgi:hypothetical protein